MDDYQQGLVPGGSEPRNVDYNKYLAMPRKPSLLDMMRQEIEDSEEVPPKSPERVHTPTSGFEFEYATNAPPDIQRMVDVPMHSTPYPPTRLRSVRDLDLICYRRAHAHRRFHRPQRQYSAWLYATCQ